MFNFNIKVWFSWLDKLLFVLLHFGEGGISKKNAPICSCIFLHENSTKILFQDYRGRDYSPLLNRFIYQIAIRTLFSCVRGRSSPTQNRSSCFRPRRQRVSRPPGPWDISWERESNPDDSSEWPREKRREKDDTNQHSSILCLLTQLKQLSVLQPK